MKIQLSLTIYDILPNVQPMDVSSWYVHHFARKDFLVATT